jgi:hypothetical protein
MAGTTMNLFTVYVYGIACVVVGVYIGLILRDNR